MPRVRGATITEVSSSETTVPETKESAPAWPIWSEEEREELKKHYPNIPLYKVKNCGQTYVIRAMSSAEWSALTKRVIAENKNEQLEASKEDELIARAAVVWPLVPAHVLDDFWKSNLAGAARSLALQIREKSGFPTISDEGRIVGPTLEIELLFQPEISNKEEPENEALELLRETSPNKSIVRVEFPTVGGVHYFRPWTRTDWELIQAQEERGNDFRDFGVRQALLWSSEDWVKPALAGVIEQLFDQVLIASGFTATPEVEEL